MTHQDFQQTGGFANAKVDGTKDLTTMEAAVRLKQFGPNMVAHTPRHATKAFFFKFWGPIPWMLELAIILDAMLGRWVEAIVVAVLLTVNALIGIMQETRATSALALLRQRLTVNARVRRENLWQLLPTSQIVPGDLMRIRLGDMVPADICITEGLVLLDQSTLTGESLPVEYRTGATAFSGSIVSRGEATGVVVNTGARTLFGKTAELVRVAQAPARLERVIVGIAKYLLAFDLLLAFAVFAVAAICGIPMLDVLPFGLRLR